jgi:putative transposase
MAKKRKHATAEIAGMLAQADDLATQGKIQSEIARTLGVSVMTLHRWRKAATEPGQAMNGSRRGDQTPQIRIAELQLENSRLRQLVTDLLLKETLQGGHRNAAQPHLSCTKSSLRRPLAPPWAKFAPTFAWNFAKTSRLRRPKSASSCAS